jgi:hypothetical protein
LEYAENLTGKKLKVLRTDRGGEYLSGQIQGEIKKRGIKHELTCPYTPQQNGVAERANQTITGAVRTMLCHMSLQHKWWGEAFWQTLWVKNRVPTTALASENTPYLIIFGQPPNVSMVRVFGCMAQYYVPEAQRHKLDSRARWGIHLGIASDQGTKGWKVWDIETKKTVVSRDVIFYEKLTFEAWQEWQQKKGSFDEKQLPFTEQMELHPNTLAPLGPPVHSTFLDESPDELHVGENFNAADSADVDGRREEHPLEESVQSPEDSDVVEVPAQERGRENQRACFIATTNTNPLDPDLTAYPDEVQADMDEFANDPDNMENREVSVQEALSGEEKKEW